MMIAGATKTWHYDDATCKQLDFISNLIKERNWKIGDVVTVRVAKIVIQRKPDGSVPVPVTKKAASHTIDKLMKLPTMTIADHTYNKNKLDLKAAAQAAVANLPSSAKGCKFAVPNTDPKSSNPWVFYELVQRKTGKFLNRLVGAPGDWKREFVNYKDYAGIVKRIEDSSFTHESHLFLGHKAAMMRYTEMFTCCSVCGAPLSAGKSIMEAMGPVCSKKF